MNRRRRVSTRVANPVRANAYNSKHLPVGYHGRSSTIVVSGVTSCALRAAQGLHDPQPVFGPSVRLDVEAEIGFIVGVGNDLGTRLGTDEVCQGSDAPPRIRRRCPICNPARSWS